jgi:hypothetical protein
MADYSPMRPKSNINFQETTVSADSLAELYRVYTYLGNGGPVEVVCNDAQDVRTPDIVQIIEIRYSSSGDYYPVNIVPDNQYLMMKNNKVIYPNSLVANTERPLGRMNGLLKYEIFPSVFYQAQARVLTLPRDVDFEFVDSGGETPDLVPGYIDTDFSEDKFNNLLFLTVTSLGFNLSNGVLVQAGAQKEFKEL